MAHTAGIAANTGISIHKATRNIVELPVFLNPAVIFLWNMTTGITAASIVGLFKSNREVPRPERDGCPDMFGQCTGVGFMAGPAGSSLRGFVDVDKMKIAIAVAKSSERCGARFRHQRRIVASETKIVFRFAE